MLGKSIFLKIGNGNNPNANFVMATFHRIGNRKWPTVVNFKFLLNFALVHIVWEKITNHIKCF